MNYLYKKDNGFTLVELLIVLAILAMLATIGFGQYSTSQTKARDAQRKADVGNIARALEMYYNDFGVFPEDDGGGLISVDKDGDGTNDDLEWGESFETDEAIYMKELPKDPHADNGSEWDYCYDAADDQSSYHLYAVLENEDDSDYVDSYDDTECGAGYTYVIYSSNAAKPTAKPTATP